MQKLKIVLVSLFFFISLSAKAQLSGADTVCMGYLYNYDVLMPGAVTYQWSLPNGWYIYSGTGTANVVLNANLAGGNVCVTGYDANSAVVNTLCKTVGEGGGGLGWDVVLGNQVGCPWSPYEFSIQPNGTGGNSGCAGCGVGIQNPNVELAIYDGPWPMGNFLAMVNSMFPVLGLPGQTITYYIYLIDHTFGVPNAVLVQGGCGNASINNSVTVSLPSLPMPLALSQFPNPACVGDTVILYTGFTSPPGILFSWLAGDPNLFLLPQSNADTAFIYVSAMPNSWNTTSLTYPDPNFPCSPFFEGTVNAIVCASSAPQALLSSSDTNFCDKNSVNFIDMSTNTPTTWQWTFAGAVPASSTLQNPINIYYPNYGSYDVTLVACNTAGCDSLFLPAFINVFQLPTPVINYGNDTLWSTAAANYQWYQLPNGVIPNATNQYYVPTMQGTYFVIVTDSNGCMAPSDTIAVANTAIENFDIAQMQLCQMETEGLFKLRNVYSKISSVEVIDVSGKNIYLSRIPSHAQNEVVLDFGTLKKGIYLLRVHGSNFVQNFKLIR